MTPERWRQIDDLFDAALRLDPAGREAWLREACGGDDDLRTEVGRLLTEDDRAAREGFLSPPEVTSRPSDSSVDFPPRDFPGHPARPETINPAETVPLEFAGGFTPKAAIAAGSGSALMAEVGYLVRKRLLALAIIYLLIFLVWPALRFFFRRETDPAILTFNTLAVVSLGAIAALLSGRRPLSPERLKSLELGMVGLIAGVIAVIYYRVMLTYSLRGDSTTAQLGMMHFVLYTAVMILTFGLASPKRWGHAALIVGPLTLLPFATLLVLCLRHPEAMGSLGQWSTPLFQLSYCAMLLLILAVGSAFETQTVFRLRREVAKARKFGQYRLRRRIGAGGMGEVYLAEHQLLKRPCALKLIRPGDMADRNALERFEREVQITATLSHPNTVEIYDYGRTEDGTYYYVMEYLPGLSLDDLVERHGPQPPARTVYLLRQVCLALHEAHAVGLIHRDVKPSNIFAARRGGMDDVAKLLDFGLVRTTAARATHLSDEGQILGTPLFMSPEQATGGRELDERSDIYSLGAVTYYLLTGRPPFDEGGGIGVMIAHARDPVVPPSVVRPGIPADLERIVLRCLAKDPADRFPDAQALERALSECACVGDWDHVCAAQWWREAGRTPANHATAT